MAIPMLKIRRPNGCLIFNMEIAIRREDGLYIETGPSWPSFRELQLQVAHPHWFPLGVPQKLQPPGSNQPLVIAENIVAFYLTDSTVWFQA